MSQQSDFCTPVDQPVKLRSDQDMKEDLINARIMQPLAKKAKVSNTYHNSNSSSFSQNHASQPNNNNANNSSSQMNAPASQPSSLDNLQSLSNGLPHSQLTQSQQTHGNNNNNNNNHNSNVNQQQNHSHNGTNNGNSNSSMLLRKDSDSSFLAGNSAMLRMNNNHSNHSSEDKNEEDGNHTVDT
jgi:hypothetical protein